MMFSFSFVNVTIYGQGLLSKFAWNDYHNGRFVMGYWPTSAKGATVFSTLAVVADPFPEVCLYFTVVVRLSRRCAALVTSGFG
jgi:hypothetical protein